MGQVAGSERRAPRAVLKFGSSVLRSPADLPWAVQEIYAHVRRGGSSVRAITSIAHPSWQAARRTRAVTGVPNRAVAANPSLDEPAAFRHPIFRADLSLSLRARYKCS